MHGNQADSGHGAGDTPDGGSSLSRRRFLATTTVVVTAGGASTVAATDPPSRSVPGPHGPAAPAHRTLSPSVPQSLSPSAPHGHDAAVRGPSRTGHAARRADGHAVLPGR
ncbi:twin-arginine translocation signal domain-containing protein [Streptomyces resistomycificus]|uniref:twin-arginine translocation signal domain-containing protein n=1 Tax=Streptomyces resistomycificus TaxID=67356 RepID=UPI000A5C10CC